jgi:hypothetical protein
MAFDREQRRRLSTIVGTAVYIVFLITAAFGHHDLLCHLKNPQHCTACVSAPLGSDPQAAPIVGNWHLKDAGRAVTVHVMADDILLPVRSTGRGPPLSA